MSRFPDLAGAVALLALSGCASTPAAPSSPVGAPAGTPTCAVLARGADRLDRTADAGPRAERLRASARQLRDQGDRASALRHLEQAAALAPHDPEVCFELADLLLAEQADLERAGAMLLALPAGHPRRDGALGRLAELRGDAETAQAAYARQLAVAEDPELRLRRALSLERLGRDAEAIDELERLRLATPGSAAGRARLAEHYEAVGRLPEAEAELRALAEASPDRPEGWRRLAAFCGRNGLAEQARRAEERAREAEARPRRELRPLRPSGR